MSMKDVGILLKRKCVWMLDFVEDEMESKSLTFDLKSESAYP